MDTQTSDITADQVFKAFASMAQPVRWLLQSDRQDDFIVLARAAVAVVLQESCGWTWEQIGIALNRSHSTVMRMVQTHRGDNDVIEMVSGLCKTLNLKQPTCTDSDTGPGLTKYRAVKVSELAYKLGVSPRTVERWINRDGLPHISCRPRRIVLNVFIEWADKRAFVRDLIKIDLGKLHELFNEQGGGNS